MAEIVTRKLSNGRKVYYARYYENGRRIQRATKQTTEKKAQEWANEVEARIRKRQVGLIEPTKEEQAQQTITVKELADRFLGNVPNVPGYASPKLHDLEDYRGEALSNYTVRIDPHLGKRAAGSVEPADVERLRDALLKDEYAGSSVVQSLALLSKMYGWGQKAKIIDCENPVVGCERPPTKDEIDFLKKEEATALLVYAEEHTPEVHPMIATAIYTGMRKGEIFGLRWIDVHLEARRIDVMRSYSKKPKSGKKRHIPIHPELARILRIWRDAKVKSDDNLVFPVEGKMGTNYDMLGIVDVLKNAECHVPGRPWHSLRHTFASHFIMSGGNILSLQKLLGHSSVAMTEKYAHLAPDFMVGEVERMSFAPSVASVARLDEARRQRDTNGHLDRTSEAVVG